MTNQSAKYRWTLYGGAFGFLVTLSDLLFAWRGVTFAPWSGMGVGYNMGQFGGSMVGGAFIGLVAGSIRDYFARRTGRIV
jgi:hypothetical protein